MIAQVAADLRAAADVLERDGWTQGRYHDDDGCHCALGAIAVAIRGSSRPNPDRWKPWAENAIRLRAGAALVAHSVGIPPDAYHHPRLDVSDWNDEYGRTAAEVIAALRAAADAAEADL